MNTPHLPDPWSRVVKDWRVTPAPNPQFRAKVWARINASGAALPWGAYVRRHVGAVAVGLTLAVGVGALAGRERAKARAEADSARLATSYVQGMDARAMARR